MEWSADSDDGPYLGLCLPGSFSALRAEWRGKSDRSPAQAQIGTWRDGEKKFVRGERIGRGNKVICLGVIGM